MSGSSLGVASDNALNTWDVPGTTNMSKLPSVVEENEKTHPDAPEDSNSPRVKPIFSEDIPPRTEDSAIKKSLEISAVTKPNNLFEIIIKKVAAANQSSSERTADTMKDQQTTGTKSETTSKIQVTGKGSFTNGETDSENHEPENETQSNSGPRRSFFDHLRKNFRAPEGNLPAAEEFSRRSECLPTTPTDINTTSSFETKVNKESTSREIDCLGEDTSISTAIVPVDSILVENSAVSISESCNANDKELNENDTKDFPFTKRLKWISQRSREGSPSLLQQQKILTETEQEKVVISTSFDTETAKKPNGISVDATRTSVITSAVTSGSSNEIGFQPLLNNTNQPSCPGSVSLRVHDGKTEVTQLSRGSVGVQSHEVYLLLDSSLSPVLELNRSAAPTNIHGNIQSENNHNVLTETGQFHVLPAEDRQQVYSVVRSPSLNGGFVNGVARTREEHFVTLNENNPKSLNNEQRLQVNRTYVPQSTVDLSSTIYSNSPVHTKAFSPMWDRRNVVTSSIPVHRVPAPVPLCYDKGFPATSTFGSPIYHPRSHGNPIVYGSQNQLYQTMQMQARQDVHFRPRFYQNPGAPIISQNVRYSRNQYITKSPPPYTVSEQVFRPVSPQWPQVLYTTDTCSSANSFAHVTKSEPTISDEDRDEFSYACALHESANSPDIERMLGSESPYENTCSVNSESSAKESRYSNTKSSVDVLSSHKQLNSHAISTQTTRTSKLKGPEFPRSNSGSARTDIKYGKSSSPKNNCLIRHSCQNVERKPKVDLLDAREKEKGENEQKEKKSNAATEQQKKRKMSLNVIHKRLEPKLPSPERETSSGDLFRDPSKLTREERALQRAMMQFSEMEMKAKVVPVLPRKRKKRIKEHQSNQDAIIETKPVETKGKLASSTWLLNIKRKQRSWLANRGLRLKKNSSDSVMNASEESQVVKVEPQSSPDETEQTIKTMMKRRRNDDQNHENTSRKHGKLMKERKKNPSKEVHEETLKVSENPDEATPRDCPPDDPPKKKKKKIKKFSEKRREIKEHSDTMIKQYNCTSTNHVMDTDPLPTWNPAMLQPTTNNRKRSIDSLSERSHRVKTYMLIPSYQGFKDFQPTVMESRTRNKRNTHHDETAKPSEKPKVPLLVVESVNSKPVKEMVVAESEEVQRLVTECLRVHGKWHGDELEQALKREENRLNEEEGKHRDTKRLSVNRTTGETILHKAARLGYHEVVKQCILRGADPNARDNAGWTPLHEACARGKLDVVRVLARYGANVNAASNDGIRPIHDAAEAGHVNVIRVLLSYGADPMLATYAGNNALVCAKEPKTKTFLKDYCADVGLEHPISIEDKTDGWQFPFSATLSDACAFSDGMSGIWQDIPDCSDSFVPEFEVSAKPHFTTYNLPVLKDGVAVGRRNYLLVQDIYDSGLVAKTTLQKKLKNIETLTMPWSEFLDILSENHLCVKPLCSPEGSSKIEPTAELIPLNYTIRKLLGIRIESCK